MIGEDVGDLLPEQRCGHLGADVLPDQLTIDVVPARLDELGDPWAEINAHPQDLTPLLTMSQADMDAGMMDAPWPPVYPKQPNEPPRVAPSRAKKPSEESG